MPVDRKTLIYVGLGVAFVFILMQLSKSSEQSTRDGEINTVTPSYKQDHSLPMTKDAQTKAIQTKYLDLLRDTLIATAFRTVEKSVKVYEGKADQIELAPFDLNKRIHGFDWPYMGISMIGQVRMDGLRLALGNVTEADVPGDFVECGVWRGGASIFAAGFFSIHGITNRKVWVVDSFDGLPPNRTNLFGGEDYWAKMDYLKVTQDQVKSNFEGFNLYNPSIVKFVKGYFVVSLPTIKVEEIALLRMDGDMYESTMDQLFNLYEKVSVGGYILVDDWSIRACKTAINDFRSWHSISDPLYTLPDGSMYWIKKSNHEIKQDLYLPMIGKKA